MPQSPRFRRPKHSSFCRVIVAARARSTSLQLPILDCRLYFTGQHRKNQYFFAGPHNFFAAACALYLSPAGRAPRPRARVTFGRSDLPAFLFDASGGPISSSSGRNGGKNAAKNQWFLEFLSSDCSCGAKRFRNESPLRLPSLPLTGHAESNGRPPVWAIIKSRTCRQRRQVWVRPAGPRPRARNIPFENKSAGRCGRRVRALRPPVRKKKDRRSGLSFLVQN